MTRKVLFVYGMKILEDTLGNYYTNGTITEKIWMERYLPLGNLTIIAYVIKDKIDYKNAQDKYSMIPNKVNVVKVNNLSESLSNFLSLKKRIDNKRIIKSYVKKNDLVIVRTPCKISYTAIKYANKYTKKLVNESVGSSFDALWYHSFKGKILSVVSFLSQKYYTKKSMSVMYVTNNFLQKKYPTDGLFTSCSDVELSSKNDNVVEKRTSLIKTYKLNRKIILGTCGSVQVRYKGHEYVIKALSYLKKIGFNNFEYQLVGGGNPQKITELSRKYGVSEMIKILGPVNHEKIFSWYDSIDIYIQPSNVEGLCRALIEAMSRALPCIASNAGGNPELIDTRYIFKKRNYKALATLLQKINKDEMIQQSVANYEKAKLYDKSILDKKRKDFYNKVIGVKHEKN